MIKENIQFLIKQINNEKFLKRFEKFFISVGNIPWAEPQVPARIGSYFDLSF